MSNNSSYKSEGLYFKNKACFAGIRNNGQHQKSIIIEFEKLENDKSKLTKHEAVKYVKDLLDLMGIHKDKLTVCDEGLEICVTGLISNNIIFIGTVLRTLYEGYTDIGFIAGEDFWKIGAIYTRLSKVYPRSRKHNRFEMAYNMFIAMRNDRMHVCSNHAIMPDYKFLTNIKDHFPLIATTAYPGNGYGFHSYLNANCRLKCNNFSEETIRVWSIRWNDIMTNSHEETKNAVNKVVTKLAELTGLSPKEIFNPY